MAGNRGFKWVGSMYAGAQCPIVQTFAEAGITVYKGNALRISGTALSGSVGLAAEATTTLYGYAVGDFTTTATEKSTLVQVVPFIPGHYYEVTGAKLTMTSRASGYINSFCDLEISTTGYSRVDTAGTTNHFKIIGPQHGDLTLTTTGAGRRWIVSITASAAAFFPGRGTT